LIKAGDLERGARKCRQLQRRTGLLRQCGRGCACRERQPRREPERSAHPHHPPFGKISLRHVFPRCYVLGGGGRLRGSSPNTALPAKSKRVTRIRASLLSVLAGEVQKPRATMRQERRGPPSAPSRSCFSSSTVQ